MKIVRVSGGLGNQMFQYAFARELERRTGDDVFLDTDTYAYEAAHQGFELDRLFPVRYNPARSEDIARLCSPPTRLASRLRRRYFPKPTHWVDRLFRYDARVFNLHGDCYLEGWWQTEKYFSSSAAVIRAEFSFKEDLGPRNRELATAPVFLVSLHVRRGDALRNPDTAVCTETYYRNAIRWARDLHSTPRFLVFSDDLAWCRASLPLDAGEAVYVDWNRGTESWQDMWLMSRCRAHIVANSTFSWWGSWLDPSPDAKTAAPAIWSLHRPGPLAFYRYTYGDIVPDSWIRLPIE